jgi:hypothetical protein
VFESRGWEIDLAKRELRAHGSAADGGSGDRWQEGPADSRQLRTRIDTAATMAETLVRLCPHVSVRATSWELLRIDGEFAYRVPALAVPAEDLEGSDDVLEHSACRRCTTASRKALLHCGRRKPKRC